MFPATSRASRPIREIIDWLTFVAVTTIGLVVPTTNDGIETVAFAAFFVMIDARPLPISRKVTSICAGGPGRWAVTRQLGATESLPPTVMGAVLPVGATLNDPPSAVALLKYCPGVDDTVTLKCRAAFPPAAAENGPDQVSTWAEMVGLALVTPVARPATYVNPDGGCPVIELRVTATVFGL